jgi:hypothetical protein
MDEAQWNLENFSIPAWDWEGGTFEACVILYNLPRPKMSPEQFIAAFRTVCPLGEAQELNTILDAWQAAITACRELVPTASTVET